MSDPPVPAFGKGVVLFYIQGDDAWEEPVYLEDPVLSELAGRWFVCGKIPQGDEDFQGRFSVAWDLVDAFAVPEEEGSGGEWSPPHLN